MSADKMRPITLTKYNEKYISTIIDAESRLAAAIPTDNKSYAPELLIKAITEIRQKHTQHNISLHTDRAAEDRGSTIHDWLKAINVTVEATPAYELQKNLMAEGWRRTIAEVSRCTKNQSKCDPKLWG